MLTHHLTLVYCSQGRCDKAEALYKHAPAGNETSLEVDHPDTRRTATNLANFYQSQGRRRSERRRVEQHFVMSGKSFIIFAQRIPFTVHTYQVYFAG
jgi:hypothetical protein